jgi:hypothetical protein
LNLPRSSTNKVESHRFFSSFCHPYQPFSTHNSPTNIDNTETSTWKNQIFHPSRCHGDVKSSGDVCCKHTRSLELCKFNFVANSICYPNRLQRRFRASSCALLTTKNSPSKKSRVRLSRVNVGQLVIRKRFYFVRDDRPRSKK